MLSPPPLYKKGDRQPLTEKIEGRGYLPRKQEIKAVASCIAGEFEATTANS